MKQGRNFKPHHFPGISVLVPKEYENEIVVVNKESLPEGTPDQTDKFTKIREVANIFFTDVEGHPITSFDPPIEVRVGYNFIDVMLSQDGISGQNNIDRLKLAYWDRIEHQWIIIGGPDPDNNPDPENRFDYLILPPSTAQVAEFKIRQWPDDPMIAWGK
jgi:hypothetical protein